MVKITKAQWKELMRRFVDRGKMEMQREMNPLQSQMPPMPPMGMPQANPLTQMQGNMRSQALSNLSMGGEESYGSEFTGRKEPGLY